MDIRYHKKGSISIKNRDIDILVGEDFSKGTKHNERIWIANPKLESVDFGSLTDDKLLINGVGEYEAGGVEIAGIKYGNDNVFYLLTIDDYRVGVLFEDGTIEEIATKTESMDVLVVLNSLFGEEKKLQALVNKTGINYLVMTGSKDENKNLLDAFDREDITPVDKLSLKSGQEVGEGLEVVLLSN